MVQIYIIIFVEFVNYTEINYQLEKNVYNYSSFRPKTDF